jgi:hypothetical protein
MRFSWLSAFENLQPAALTLAAQLNAGILIESLRYPVLMPRRDVDSIKINDITTRDFQPVADRREWNARSRPIPPATVGTKSVEMVPIEARFKYDERQMQLLAESTLGNADLIAQQIQIRIPDRSNALADADYRRLELDVFEAWTRGQVTVRNPETGESYVASFGFAAGRIQTALTPWSDPSIDALTEFISWYIDGLTSVGPGLGVMLSRARFNEIAASRPEINGQLLPISQLEDYIRQQTLSDFRFFIEDRQLDVFVDGGLSTAKARVMPVDRIAFIPATGEVGYSAFAPVARAMEIDAEVPEAGVDIRGVTVYHEQSNNGRELELEAQLNAMPIPNEDDVWVMIPV